MTGTIANWKSYVREHAGLAVAGAMLVAFLIPVYNNLVPAALVLFFVLTLIKYKSSVQISRIQLPLLSLLLLYMLYLTGMFYTESRPDGWVVLERKLLLLLLPVYFIFFKPLTFKQLQLVLLAFVMGCLVYAVIMFAGALSNYLQYGDTDSFYSQKISTAIHPTYMALYINMAVLILSFWAIYFRKSLNRYLRLFLWFGVMIFSLYILLLASKGGILALCITWMAVIMYYFYSISRWYIGVLAVVVSVGTLIYLVRYPTVTRWKFQRATEIYYMPIDSVMGLYKETTESNAVRRMVWHVSWQSVNENPWGYGTGDSKNHLYNRYKQLGMTGAFERKLNCHNQYLETTMAVGIPGLVLLLLFIFSAIWVGIRNKAFVLCWLMVITAINMLFESMFETQAGVVFIVFCVSLLVTSPPSADKST